MVVVTAVAATVGVAVFGGGSPLPAGSDGGCDPLQVAAAPADAPALRDLADRFARLSRPRQDCRTVEVSTVESAQMAGRLAAGWDPARWGPVPDLWIPESRAWVTRAEAGRGAAALAPAGPSLASSPVVLAMPQPMGDALGWPRRPLSIRQVEQLMTDAKGWAAYGHPEWGWFHYVQPHPATSFEGMAVEFAATINAAVPPTAFRQADFQSASLVAFQRAVSRQVSSTAAVISEVARAGGAGDVSAFPATEQAVWAYNTGQPRARLRAFPLPGAPAADFPLVTPPEGGNRQAALAKLIAFLRGPSALPVLEANGLRSGDGSPAGFVTPGNGLLAGRGPARPLTVDAGTVDAALAAWTQLSRPVNVLAMVDASGSMAATHGFDQPMIDVVAEALDDGLDLLPPGSASGLAVFSAASDRSPLLRDLVPLESQSARLAGLDHTQAIRQALEQVRPAGGTPLYDAVLRAYQTVQHAYRPGMINVVLLLSDGIAEDARTPLTLPALLSTLHREADPKRPVRIVTIACHDEGQTGDLQKIATATSGRSLAVYVPRSAATGGVGPAQGTAGKWVEPPDITSLIAEAVVGL